MVDQATYHLDQASKLAARIRSMVREFARLESHSLSWVEWPEGDLTESDAFWRVDNEVLRELIEALGRELKLAEFQPEAPFAETGWWPALRVGYVRVTLPPRQIHRGYLYPASIVPAIIDTPEQVAAFLIKIPGEEYLLHRDNHGFLWHYHYTNSKGDHSDTVLCWDTRATLSEKSVRPIFQEKHAVGGKHFAARPDLWGAQKRKTMHDAAYPDLKRWSLSDFRCASNKSQPVWPLNACLTPVPPKASALPKHLAKSKKGRQQ